MNEPRWTRQQYDPDNGLWALYNPAGEIICTGLLEIAAEIAVKAGNAAELKKEAAK